MCILKCFVFISTCSDLLRENNNNADAIYVKALCLYYQVRVDHTSFVYISLYGQDATDKAHQFLQRVLRDDPDNKKAIQLIKVRPHPFLL